MSDGTKAGDAVVLADLERAVSNWTTSATADLLERWVLKELDDEGVPKRLPIPAWWACLRYLALARTGRAGLPRRLDSRILDLSRSLLRFAGPDGTPTADPGGSTDLPALGALLSQVAGFYPRSGEARVVAWLLGRPDPNHSPPPLPAWSSPDQALGVLRATWKKQGDLLAVDQRRRTPTAAFTLIGSGVTWLGPDWRLDQSGSVATPARPGLWQSNSVADLFEWSYRAAGLRATRTAVMLRGRRMAILGEQVSLGKTASSALDLRFGLARGVRAEPLNDSRGVRLSVDGKKVNAQVLPIGLPALPYETERGRFEVDQDGRSLSLSMIPRGRRSWLPLLVSWDPTRHRKRLSWRQLTVSEDGRVCPPETAFAVRVSWGRDDTIVVYRSLGPPAHRAFLGHQTEARFLVGTFSSDGVVEPLVTVEA